MAVEKQEITKKSYRSALQKQECSKEQCPMEATKKTANLKSGHAWLKTSYIWHKFESMENRFVEKLC